MTRVLLIWVCHPAVQSKQATRQKQLVREKMCKYGQSHA